VISYLLYAVISNKIDKWVWICLGLILLEGLVLLIFKMICPITVVARKYSNSSKDNFDIYLPNWLASYTKAIYTTIVLICVLILIYRLFKRSS
jgi:spore maturation protein SpmA